MFRGIRIFERMTKICTEQGDNAVFTIAEWLEELEEKNERLTLSEANLSERNRDLLVEVDELSRKKAGENYDKYIASSIENCDLRREAEANERQVKRLLAVINRLEGVSI